MVISHSYVTNYQRVCCLIWKWVASGEVSFGFTSLVVPAAPWIWAYHLAKLGEVNTGFPWVSFQTIWNCQPKGTRAPEKPPPLRQSFLLSFRGQTIQAIVWQEATGLAGTSLWERIGAMALYCVTSCLGMASRFQLKHTSPDGLTFMCSENGQWTTPSIGSPFSGSMGLWGYFPQIFVKHLAEAVPSANLLSLGQYLVIQPVEVGWMVWGQMA